MNDQQPDIGRDLRQGVNLVMLLARVHAACITPFIRTRFGIQYPGVHAVFAIVLMLLYGSGMQDIRMFQYFEAWFVVLIVQRIHSGRLWRRGWREHSQYEGWPWAAMLVPFARTEERAKEIEPGMCVILGGCLLPWSGAVGLFVGAGGISLAICRSAMKYARQRQILAMHDLRIEQQLLSHRLRELNSNRWNMP